MMCLFDLSGEKRRKHQAEQDRRMAMGVGAGIAIGAVVGALAGILLAPQSGKETRAAIKDTAGKAADSVHHTFAEAKEKMEHMSEECCTHHGHGHHRHHGHHHHDEAQDTPVAIEPHEADIQPEETTN